MLSTASHWPLYKSTIQNQYSIQFYTIVCKNWLHYISPCFIEPSHLITQLEPAEPHSSPHDQITGAPGTAWASALGQQGLPFLEPNAASIADPIP